MVFVLNLPEPQFPHLQNGNHIAMLSSLGCWKMRTGSMLWTAQQWVTDTDMHIEVSKWLWSIFPTLRSSSCTAMEKMQDLHIWASRKVREKWLLRTQGVRRLQSKVLPTTSFRQIVKNIFKDQHIEIKRNKCNYLQCTTLWN